MSSSEVLGDGPALPSIVPFGEAALLVTLADAVAIPHARRAEALAVAIRELRQHDARWGPPIAGAASVLARFDPLVLDVAEARETLGRLVQEVPASPPAPTDLRKHVVEVAYGGEAGPDLEELARMSGHSTADVVDLHAGATYEVAFLGFAPGFGYLLSVPPPIALPRLSTPRPRVAAGSVGIAGSATGIYPVAMPGGWRIIGRTQARLFDPVAREPARLRPGDLVTFVPA